MFCLHVSCGATYDHHHAGTASNAQHVVLLELFPAKVKVREQAGHGNMLSSYCCGCKVSTLCHTPESAWRLYSGSGAGRGPCLTLLTVDIGTL